jgi:hypothetical protein
VSVACHPLVYADNDNFLAKSINTMKQNTEALLGASKKVGLRESTH